MNTLNLILATSMGIVLAIVLAPVLFVLWLAGLARVMLHDFGSSSKQR